MSSTFPLPLGGSRLSSDEAADLVARVAQLSNAGLPLASGLRAAADELPKRSAAALRDLAQTLDEGRSLNEAMASLKDRVPSHLGGLIQAGLRSGQLGQVLEGYVQQQRSAALHRQAWLALAYPAVLILLVSGIVLFFAFFVATGFASIYPDFGTELPPQTELLVSMSRIGWQAWLGAAACIASLLVLDWLLLDKRLMRTLVSMLPMIGALRRWLSMGRLCRLLALLVQQQIPLPEALRLAADAVGDPLLRRDVRRVSQRVEAGLGMADAARGTRLPATFAALAGCAESGPALASSLVAAAELFESQAENEVKLLRIVAPALAFIIVLLIVFFLVSSTMLPMVKIIETLT